MKISSAFPSEYLRASDLMGREVTATIKNVVLEEVGREREERPVLYFRGKEKGLVLNKTNANTIAALFGDDTDDWTGGEVTLFEAQVEYQGKMTPSIRVKRAGPPKAAAKREIPPAVTSPPAADLDSDDIPF